MNTIIFIVILLLIFWCYQGYFIYLYLFRRRGAKVERNSFIQGKIYIVVLVYNEVNLIRKKIDNIKEINYDNFEVYFADASTDQTPEIILDKIKGLANFHMVRASKPGRSFQLNEALALIKEGIVFVSDVDALCAPSVLDDILKCFSQSQTAVVGGYVWPESFYFNNNVFWSLQNIARIAESSYGHCPAVSGAGYAFRRELLERIPEDVWAEDIYIPFLANLKGFNCFYRPDISIKEIRGPRNFSDFCRDKIRKVQDNIKEILRFLPAISAMKFRWFIVYITRFIQILVLPVFVWVWFVLLFFQNFHIIIGSIIFLFCGLIPQKYVFRKFDIIGSNPSLFDIFKMFFLTNFIILTALLKYLFSKGKVRYIRLADSRGN